MAMILVVIVLAACIAPVFATSPYTDHASTVGRVTIDVPGHPKIGITFAHFDHGDHGAGNSIAVYEPFPPPYNMMIVAWIRNTESQANWAAELVSGMPAVTPQVRSCQLQVNRIGKIATVMWTFPIVVPEETWVGPTGTYVTPAVTIPPGCLILRGYGSVKTSTEIMGPFKSGWTLTSDGTGYDACATFICPSWHYCGSVGSGSDCFMRMDVTMTATHP
jgi:hypothetical protein